MNESVYTRRSYLFYRWLLVAVLAITLMFFDTFLTRIDFVRSAISTLLTPVYWVSGMPRVLVHDISESMESREQLLDENAALKAKVFVLERKAQKYGSLSAEINRLRELLSASALIDDKVVIAELVAVSPDPYSHHLVIDKGARDGLMPGMAVLDDSGLVGQIIEVSEFTSRVLMITDSSHAVPVQNNRSGVRAILLGTGSSAEMELAHVPDTADMQVGDLLVSSGLGGRFPRGYPVAEVTKLERDPSKPFARVSARPKANLDRSYLLLVVFRSPTTELPEANEVDAVPEGERTPDNVLMTPAAPVTVDVGPDEGD